MLTKRVILGGMTLNMNDTQISTINDVKEFLLQNDKIQFNYQNKAQAYAWVEDTLVKFIYIKLSKTDKGILRTYVALMTGYSRAQVTRLYGVGRIEYAYHFMALEAGINMMPCRLLEENGRAHFITKRFDRLHGNEKIHVQSFWALAHLDHGKRAYSYEQVLSTILQLRLDHEHIQEMYRRMVFNILARNQDDHTKNIAFMMNKAGSWRLSPAFDMVWQYDPSGRWSSDHQLSANGKRDDFSIVDLESVADRYGIYKAKEIRNQVADAVALWPKLAKKAGIKAEIIRYLKSTHRLHIMG